MGTIISIFIEIGSYVTEKEQKISSHSFFESRCILSVHLSETATPSGELRIVVVASCKKSDVDTENEELFFLLTPTLQGTPVNYHRNLISPETRVLGLYVCRC